MTRGGPRAGSGRPKSPDPRKAYPVYLTARERDATVRELERGESWQDFAREALASEVQRRLAIRDAAIREARRRRT